MAAPQAALVAERASAFATVLRAMAGGRSKGPPSGASFLSADAAKAQSTPVSQEERLTMYQALERMNKNHGWTQEDSVKQDGAEEEQALNILALDPKLKTIC